MGAGKHGPIMPGVSLLADENPWALDPLDLTLYASVRAQGLSVAEAARKYFVSLPGLPRRNQQYISGLMRSGIMEAILNISPYTENERLTAIWKATTDWRVTINQQDSSQQAYWRELFSREPLVVTPPLTEGEMAGLPAVLPEKISKPRPVLAVRKALTAEVDLEAGVVLPERTEIIWPKKCEKCGAPMQRQRDQYSEFSKCKVGCGFSFDPVVGAPVDLPVEGGSFYEQPTSNRKPSHGKLKL